VDKSFQVLVEGLHQKYMALTSMPHVSVDTAPADTPTGGVYLFSEHGIPLYAGRTKRKIRDRLKNHVCTSDDCPFAWRLAREATGMMPSYRKEGSRSQLLKNPVFKKQYENAKKRIRKMEVRYVGEDNPLKQALLEIYVAVVSMAKHNDFDTH